ncbi:glycoside hydrolase family 127 protein [Pontiella sulfatireligans]|uniref:Non-reducing end beta-L-arabinofuranosidase n=1 Tax=Pontiella sulfatireligans TaxID=2750658 RepID=A0A6C2UN78_9BACT|nr:glycoside hydrolase family 127 protein [Pontiella sulfatireligans]VGO21725.1 Non-reducing end beta-L-arabinofuranosidase [Pontiella sulfatireligans]
MKTLKRILIVSGVMLAGLAQAQQQGIINNSKSGYAALKSINIGDCRWTDGLLGDKYRQCEEVMMPHMGTLLKGDVGHAYNNFKKAAGMMEGPALGMWWHDGDFYKWMESAVYVYANNKDPEILADLDGIIEVIAAAQDDDGYLSTTTQTRKGRGRWTDVTSHELYNNGHLMTAACIHNRLTGKTNFLDIAVKNADYLCTVFMPKTKDPALLHFAFNPSQIMGLVELYRTTGNKKYLDLAGIFIDMRGTAPSTGWGPLKEQKSVPYFFLGSQNQMQTPFREETKAVGHAVLGMYLYAGAADVYMETGEAALLAPLESIWEDVNRQKMYVTGALGQTHHGAHGQFDMVHEAFLEDYLMHNATAYNETCANIANAMFNWRMLSIKGESKYADIMELVLYNSALVGMSEDGKHYFYANPLRKIDGHLDYSDTESAHREPYIDCFCCPPNLVRTIAKLSGWAYSLSENGVAVNLYGGNKLNTKLQDGSAVKLEQETQYPWDGSVKITMEACKAEPFELALRIPGWAEGSTLKVNGEAVEAVPGTFAKINRAWKAGDVVALDMPMEIKLVEGNPVIEEIRNQAAIKRGPVVYCMETPDLPEGTGILDVYLPLKSKLKAKYRPGFLGGLTTITGKVALRQDEKEGMYRTLDKPKFEPFKAQFVPYYSWSNRGDAEMTVFMPLIWD